MLLMTARCSGGRTDSTISSGIWPRQPDMTRELRGGFLTHWTTFGRGPRAALMIHCSLAQTGIWAGMAQGLSDAFSMTAFDILGHGQSGDWHNRGELSAVCTDIAADFAAEHATMDFISHSFGGGVA